MTFQDWYNFFGVIFFIFGVPLLLLMILFRFISWWQDTEAGSLWRNRAKRVIYGKRWKDW